MLLPLQGVFYAAYSLSWRTIEARRAFCAMLAVPSVVAMTKRLGKASGVEKTSWREEARDDLNGPQAQEIIRSLVDIRENIRCDLHGKNSWEHRPAAGGGPGEMALVGRVHNALGRSS